MLFYNSHPKILMSLLAFNNMLKPLNHIGKKHKMLIAKMIIDFS
jgi:hypothetical protein